MTLLLLGVWLRRAAVRLVRALPAVAAGLAGAIPVLVSTVHAVRAGWEPAGDDGIILTRAWDVLTAHSPLVGQYSEAGNVTGQVVHSPGPLLYWLLALPVRFGSTTGAAVTMGAVNTLAIVACVALARRRGGLVLMFATAAGIALMCQSLAAESFHDVWNPAASLFPFLLLIFLCWSLACGEYRLAPPTALVASFVTQTHLAFVVPTLGLLAVAVGGLLLRRRANRRRGVVDAQAEPAKGRSPTSVRRVASWRWLAAVAAVLAVCWAPPLLDEIEHSAGNLTLIVATTSHRGTTLGAAVGWHAVVDAVGWKPWWLYVPKTEWNRKYDVRATPGGFATGSTLAILAALVLVMAVALARRRGDLAAAAAIGLVLCAALDANVAETPVVPLLAATIGYTAWWGSMLGLWVWLVLGWALWLSLRWLAHAGAPARRRAAATSARRSAGARRAAAVLASLGALGATVATASAVAGTQKPDSHANQYRPIAALVTGLDRVVPAGRTVRFELGASDISTQPIEPGVRFGLVRHGDLVLSRGAHQRLGFHYELQRRSYGWLVLIANGQRRRRNMLRVVTVHFRDYWGRHTFSAWVARVGAGGGLAIPAPRSGSTQ